MNQTYRTAAERAFRANLAPLLALADAYPDASEVFIDGDQIRLADGHERQVFSFGNFPGLTPQSVAAAGAAAAVFAGVEFGPHPPALPTISVKIPPDLRVTFAMPPVSDKWHVAVRFLRSRRLTLDDYVEQGVATQAQVEQIKQYLNDPSRKRNIIVSGGTGTGKTTLLRALLSEICGQERIVVIEDIPELSIEGDQIVHLHTTLKVDLAYLLRQTLRLTPDRIVVGEVRGPEALEMIRAMNTGHDGTLATLHSNGAREALARLHTLVAEAQPSFPREAVESAVDVVLQLKGQGSNRKLTDVYEVNPRPSDRAA